VARPVVDEAGLLEERAACLADLLGSDAVGGVVGLLFGAAPGGFVDGGGHRFRDFVGVEEDPAVDIAGGASSGLGERTIRTQEALLVRVEDGDECNFRNVKAFA
jgi:hypothetical protein